MLRLDEWPPQYRINEGAPFAASSSKADERIAKAALRDASRYVERHSETAEPETQARVHAVLQLLLQAQFGGQPAYVTTADLQGCVRPFVGQKGVRWIRREIVGHLRDEGLLITIGARGGYRLPLSADDMLKFVQHAQDICVPMLSRLELARTAVTTITLGDVDLLGWEGYSKLRAMVDLTKEGPKTST